ncbi:hypothetical protein B9J78_06440 [bacterium Unc6]|nr:hypothetical protein [bacterium Unc6]
MKRLFLSLFFVFAFVGISFAQQEVVNCFNYKKAGDYQKAISYLKKAIEIAERYGNYHGLAQYLLNLGDTYRRTKDFIRTEQKNIEGWVKDKRKK